MADLFDLTSKVGIVTGGAGGIGKALALGLAEHGADVVVTSRTLSKLEPVAAQIKALGKKSLAVASDVTDERSVKAMVEQVVQTFSHVDILVNAAGINIRNSAEEISIDDWKKVMDFNALGTFVCCQAVGRVMIKQKSGKIVNVSSVRGRYGAPSGAIAYSPSKGAVDTLTRTLACEWAKYNIFVNAVAPTLIETDLTRQALANPEFAKTMKARIPLGRWGFPEDVVGPTVFLASKASDFVTGQIIYVDGGTTTW
ncbi:MAG: glucose 1-dehydrogenase [Dehalococcoidia bacterium]|nr:glucose 1-dehydrogenase [Dehalococcoidia bacterium]